MCVNVQEKELRLVRMELQSVMFVNYVCQYIISTETNKKIYNKHNNNKFNYN